MCLFQDFVCHFACHFLLGRSKRATEVENDAAPKAVRVPGSTNDSPKFLELFPKSCKTCPFCNLFFCPFLLFSPQGHPVPLSMGASPVGR